MKSSKAVNTAEKTTIKVGSEPAVKEKETEQVNASKTGTFTAKTSPSEPTSIICGNDIIYLGKGVSEVSYTIPG